MSRDPSEPSGAGARPRGPGRPVERARSQHAARGRAHGVLDLVLMLVAFGLCSAIAGLAGAPNLGTALTFGQIGFAVGAVYVVLRR
jgi:hypothetical protein